LKLRVCLAEASLSGKHTKATRKVALSPIWHLPSTYLKYKGSRQLTSISKQRESKRKERKAGNIVLRLLHAVNVGIMRRFAAARLPGLRVRIPPGGCCECCVLLSRGLQGSPTDCGAPFCVFWKPKEWGGNGTRWSARPQEICGK
jgi:hypothetical protein